MQPTALIDFPRQPTEAASPRLRLAFDAPLLWLAAQTPADVQPVIDEAQRQAESGRWCVGYVRYEAAPAFDPALVTHEASGPLACFAVFDSAREWHAPMQAATGYATGAWNQAWSRAEFDRHIATIHEAIRDGEVYQVNLTTPLQGSLEGDPLAWFDALLRGQPRGYALYLAHTALEDTSGGGERRLLSVSPELFFDWRDGRLLSQPMKGTAARGASPEADAAAARALAASEKERAENLMIVDLLRNDFARLAQTGSVRVPRLFELHALPTVWQMTSTIEAQTRAGLRLSEVFGALFPCGSVTGAPKIAAMRRIHAQEGGPRGIYCGAAGVIAPGGAATFNVPIRSVELAHEAAPAARAGRGAAAEADTWRARCGIGSGITLDATAAGEAAEWQVKRRFLERAARPFALLESLRLQDGRIWLLQAHLRRLQASAAAFGYPCDDVAVRHALSRAAAAHARGSFKLRLLLDADGHVQVQADGLLPLAGAAGGPARVALAREPVAADGEFVRHKTTRREAYAPFTPAPAGCIDTLLWNAEGELTEFTIANLALQVDGRWLTPAAECGLLPGTYRGVLLEQGALAEARLRLADLQRAKAAAFLNSVRGWVGLDLPGLQAQARGLAGG
ncbi:MAG: bifunctional aminodeoxychorismate synthase component I/aminotransferase [Aquabacterium sp.]|nr:MAG: bifunctional aminodeoxychorismate synthase component I/aminotransferase [Aquabacterium sp.]